MAVLPVSATSMPSSPTTDVWVVLPPGVVLLDFAGAAEAFRIAAHLGADFRLHVAVVRQSLAAGDSVEAAATHAGLGSARQLRRLWNAHAATHAGAHRRRLADL